MSEMDEMEVVTEKDPANLYPTISGVAASQSGEDKEPSDSSDIGDHRCHGGSDMLPWTPSQSGEGNTREGCQGSTVPSSPKEVKGDPWLSSGY
ncbi:unnamed protein product [Calypogeia fissa]